VPVLVLGPPDLPGLASRIIASPDALARIVVTLQAGHVVVVPDRPVLLDGRPTTAWYDFDPATGDTGGLTEDGGHQSVTEYSFAVGLAGFEAGVLTAEFVIQIVPPKDIKAWKSDISGLGFPSITLIGLLLVSGGKEGISGNEAGYVGVFA